MVTWLWIVLGTVRSAVLTHRELALENLALRQQLAVRKAREPRPRLMEMDRIFLVLLSRPWACPVVCPGATHLPAASVGGAPLCARTNG